MSVVKGIWSDRKIIVAVSGGIACYKACTLVSRLVQAGAVVRVLMTESATRFVAPLSFQALSGRSVLASTWQTDDHPESQHIGVARWCELLIIAPATAHLMARMAAGLCDDVVSLTAAALPQQTPVLLAPAMNAEMWANPITQHNLERLQQLRGHRTVGPEEGWQVCRTQGPGRMSEPGVIIEAAAKMLGR